MSTVVDTCDDLILALTEKALVDSRGLSRAQAFQKSHPDRGPRELTDHLVEEGVLTRFQADTLVRGAGSQLVLSHFVLVDVLGSGSMGSVYKARSTRDAGWYAIKLVPRKNVINLKSIAEKVAALQQVRHPRVSAMVHVGAQNDKVYLVWPLLEGGTKLDELVARQGKLSPRQAAQVALQVASGLQAYHAHNLFHGLLKPSDVLIGSDRRVRIMDFGVGFLLSCERGKALLSTMTNGKALAKGLDCASPEAIIDPLARSIHGDQYSLGCILYYCMTGQFPFPDANPVKKMLGHQFEEPTPLRQLAPEATAKMAAIVARMMHKQPEERYATIDEAISDLQAVTSESRNGVSAAPSIPSAGPSAPIRPSSKALPGVDQATPAPATQPAPEEEEAQAPPAPTGSKESSRLGTWLTLAGVGVGIAAGLAAWFLLWR